MHAHWYFDVISPYSYLQFLRLNKVADRCDLSLKPVLFAGLLNANGQKGPAEIPSKRLFTYRMVTWMAAKRGVPFTFPDAHPFNPIRALRLCVALGSTPDVVGKVFHAVWGAGQLPDTDTGWAAIQRACGIDNGDELISDPAVKKQLIENGEQALAENVFGVPSFVAGGEVFWGDDSLDFFSDWIDDPGVLATLEMKQLDDLPSNATRI
ncbi:MAG: 2-hydroxychromene-2-carboxylate isomerase [Rhodospirillales bacterium]|nr:2-hydroxychromene-2-carboxylate isomerase [Rhodospirillales bacterium]MBO6785735.1 2-hydroxychromene-2-carboxylate isomerase [Rhodospirillales bacterium]